MADALTTRLVVYRPGGGDPVARLWPTTWSASFVHNDPGDSAMSVEVATGVPGERLDRGASWLQTDAEVAVEINGGSDTSTWDGFAEVPNGRFLVVQETHDSVLKTGTAIRATLVPFAWLLTKAHVGPGPSGGKKPPDPGKRRFVGTIGAILRQLMDEAQNQSLLETVRCNVWGNVDSRNRAWPTNTVTQLVDIGTDYLTLFRSFVAAGYCDMTTQGSELVFLNPTSDNLKVTPPVLNTGSELLSVPWERDNSNIAHQALIMGDGGSSAWTAPTAASRQSGPWGKWEMVTHLSGVKATTTAARDKARSLLNLYASGRTTASAGLSLDPAGSLPFRSYGLGGWVQIQTQDGGADVFQVSSIALSQPQSGPMTGSLELGQRKIIPEKRLTHAVTKLAGGAGVAGLATPGITRPPDPSQSTGGYLDYAPVWTTTGTAPVLGTGSIVGRYWVDGTTCLVAIDLTTGTGTAYGTGQWFFSLPAEARVGAPGQALQVWIRSASGSHFMGLAPITDSLRATLLVSGAVATGALSVVSPTAPHTWSTGDNARVFGTYELAVDP